MIQVKSYAKVNLFLKVINKKENNYHNLQMLNKKIDLYDLITIEYNDVDSIEITNNIDTSFIKKVLSEIKCKYKIEKCFHIYIEKRIPVGAGLGGGSMNAATIIKTILDMEKIPYNLYELIDEFKHLGADIAYGLIDDDAIVEGEGERIYILNDKITKKMVLVNPGIEISTKDVFSANKKYSNEYTHDFIKANINNDDLFINDLEEAAFTLFPEMQNLKQILTKYGKVVMSGTGSSFVVHTKNYQDIKTEFKDYLVVKI